MRSVSKPRARWRATPRRSAPDRADHAGRTARACRARRRGFTGYLVKPVRAASLAARLATRLRQRSRRRRAETPTDSCAAARKPLSILVAEDNEINALLARALLTRLGHRPTMAETAPPRSRLARRRDAGAPYDLVLMDVHMPDIDGIEVTRRIRAAEPQRGGAHADHRAHRQRLRRGPRGLPGRRHG